jgi:hypothetical protein
MNAKWLALALVLGGACSAQAQGPCEPERTINALANAVTRVAPLFIKPRAAPETLGLAPLPPPPSAPQPSMTREEWKQSLIEQGRRFCERYPDDSVCSAQQ